MKRFIKNFAAFIAAFVVEFFNFSLVSLLILVGIFFLISLLEGVPTGIMTGVVFRAIIAFLAMSGKVISDGADSKEKRNTGWAIYVIMTTIIDYFFYPAVIFNAGLVIGSIVLIIFSLVFDRFLIFIYDKSRKDWLGVNEIKKLRSYRGEDAIGRFFSLMLKKGRYAAILALTIKSNPFLTTIITREKERGLSGNDWKIFFFSLVFGNLVWIIAIFTGWKIFQFLV